MSRRSELGRLRDRIAAWSDARDVFANSGWLVFDNLARMALALGVSSAMARSLGPELNGVLKSAVALVMLCSSFTNLGLFGIVVRELAKAPEDAPRTMGTTSVLYVLGSLVSAVVCVVVGTRIMWDDPLKLTIVYIMTLGVLFHAPRIYELWFQYRVASKYAIWAKGLPSILSAVAIIVAAFYRAGPITFAIIIVADTIVSAFALAVLGLLRNDVPRRLTFAASRATYLLSQSWPLIASGVAVKVYLKLDQIMLQRMSGDVETGVYSVAVDISEVWYILPTALAASAFAGIVSAYERDHREYVQRIQDLLDLIMLGAIGLVLVVSLTAEPFIGAVYDDEYLRAAPMLRVHIFACPFVFMGAVLSKTIITEGYLKFSFVRHTAGALVNVALNLALIPRMGGLGAAWATVISYAVANYVACALHPDARRMFRQMSRTLVLPIRLLIPRRSDG